MAEQKDYYGSTKYTEEEFSLDPELIKKNIENIKNYKMSEELKRNDRKNASNLVWRFCPTAEEEALLLKEMADQGWENKSGFILEKLLGKPSKRKREFRRMIRQRGDGGLNALQAELVRFNNLYEHYVKYFNELLRYMYNQAPMTDECAMYWDHKYSMIMIRIRNITRELKNKLEDWHNACR